ncbi:MAG: hypothetical protein HYY43_03490 [Deltaproteobacteria bacterium]|nr:hypothetical protein [Deltaproteobacteria bacterium]MBI2342546.1 hypothetical protein [Deltaproteobacteria bacterium]MBI2974632.1 hypothetical protein [Deltaproteobacteria bacterium]
MIEYKIFLGCLSTFIAVAGYIVYFRQIFSGKVKPHAFSWFTWGLIVSIAFAAQFTEQGGAGAWVTGFTALACFATFVLALIKGNRSFSKLDWSFLTVALLAILLWWLTKNPTLSVILIALADAAGGILPTIRKSYYRPNEEGAALFALSAVKWVPALFALESFSLATWLYPASLIFTNTLVVLVILARRQQLKFVGTPS